MLGYLRANNSEIFTYRLFAIDCNNAIHWSNHVSMDNIFGFVTTFTQSLFELREAAFSLLQISTRIGPLPDLSVATCPTTFHVRVSCACEALKVALTRFQQLLFDGSF